MHVLKLLLFKQPLTDSVRRKITLRTKKTQVPLMNMTIAATDTLLNTGTEREFTIR